MWVRGKFEWDKLKEGLVWISIDGVLLIEEKDGLVLCIWVWRKNIVFIKISLVLGFGI